MDQLEYIIELKRELADLPRVIEIETKYINSEDRIYDEVNPTLLR